MSHMPATPRVIPPGSITQVINARDYGAVGDGSTDDTEALQDALDRAAALGGTRGSIVSVPASATAYMFSNLKMPAYVALVGSHMSGCKLKRITGSTGTAIREKTAVEDVNGYGASGIWIRDIHIDGNSTVGDGIDLGNQVPGAQFNFLAGLENIFVSGFTSGVGVKLYANAISCKYVWSNSNQVGVYINSGGGSVFHSLFAESNTLYDLRIASLGNMFFGVQTEPLTGANPSILVEGNDNLFSGVFIGPGGNKSALIKNATGADRNVYRDVYTNATTSGYTFTHLIQNEPYASSSTGSTVFHVSEYVVGQTSGTSSWYVNQSTGSYVKRAGDSTEMSGASFAGAVAMVPGANDALTVRRTTASGVSAWATPILNIEDASAAAVNFRAPAAIDKAIYFSNPSALADGGIVYDNASLQRGFQFRTGGNTTRVSIDSSGTLIVDSNSIRLASATGPLIKSGTGTPEGVVTGPVGSLFLRTDGGATTTLYVKTSGTGNTGWTAK